MYPETTAPHDESEQQSKNDMKFPPLIFQHLLTSKNPMCSSSSNNGSSRRVLAFDFKKILNLKLLVESKQME